MDTRKRRSLTPTEQVKRQELAHSLDFLTQDDWCTLAGITPVTEEQHRKRGVAPPHVVIGNTVLYFRDGARQFLLDRMRERRSLSGKAAL